MNEHIDELDAEEKKVLREALSDNLVEAVPTPEYAVELRRRLLSAATRAPAVRQRTNRRVLIGAFVGASVAALVLTSVWLLNAEPAWASAIRKAREQTWIHASIEQDGRHQGDLWASPERDVMGLKLGQTTLFFDYRQQVFLRYTAGQKEVYRAFEPESAQLTHELVTVSGLASWFRQSPGAPELLPGQTIDRWSLRSALVDGVACDEYEIVVQRQDRAASTLYLTVDKRRSLPRSITMSDAGSHTVTCRFDYPATVALDKQFLGIPADARMIDIDQSDELRVIAQSLRDGRTNFDDYTALCVTSPFGEPRPLMLCEAMRVVRRGNRWRADDIQTSDRQLIIPWNYDLGNKAWRQNKHRLQLVPRAICDGRSIRVYDPVRKSAHGGRAFKDLRLTNESQTDSHFRPFLVPERACRPFFFLGTFDRVFKVAHEETSTGDEIVTVDSLPTASTAKANSATRLRTTYWLDPKLENVAVKFVFHPMPGTNPDLDATSSTPTEIVLRDFIRSPRGFWYPRSVARDLSLPSKRITRFYVDFEDIPSDDLFRISD
jgi:hypothetical protein